MVVKEPGNVGNAKVVALITINVWMVFSAIFVVKTLLGRFQAVFQEELETMMQIDLDIVLMSNMNIPKRHMRIPSANQVTNATTSQLIKCVTE